ncbi:MAG TPA: GNAT family N-acetyltransferase [Coleofasciculaceae cyanobacterium]
MPGQPTLLTKRLLFRPFTLDDVPSVERLAGTREIAESTISIPHPYESDYAEQWIVG